MTNQKYGISISDYNVPDNGTADASKGIQKALDSGGPLIYIPYGTYRINKGLLISGNTRLSVHPEARLVFGEGAGKNASDFLMSNRNPEKGDSNISISGGIWDGNNINNPRGKEGDLDAYTGTMLNMKNVSGLELRNMRLKDSTAYFTRLTKVKNFRIEHIEFQITHLTRNQDGIHCAGFCENGDIHDISAHGTNTTGDDLVALNADDALLRSELLGAEAGPIRNLRISQLNADDCHSFIRMASIWAEISDIDIRGVYGGCRNMALNADGLRYCLVPLFDSNDAAYSNGVGMLRNIRIAEADVYKTGSGDRALFCLESRMENFRLVDIHRNMERDTCPEAPFLKINNVFQNKLIAEFADKKMGSEPGFKSIPKIGGLDKHVFRFEADKTINNFTISQSDYISELFTGSPKLNDLPPANNMVGMA